MNRLSTIDGKKLCADQGWPWQDGALGIDCTFVEPQLTPKQLRGYWLLLGAWLKLKPMPGVDKDDLHKWVCSTHFGHVERELPDGRIDWIPVRTTTKIWDEEQKRYLRKRLTRELESELIEFVYRTAAEGDVELPELKEDGHE